MVLAVPLVLPDGLCTHGRDVCVFVCFGIFMGNVSRSITTLVVASVPVLVLHHRCVAWPYDMT